jgi:hypothetical protein
VCNGNVANVVAPLRVKTVTTVLLFIARIRCFASSNTSDTGARNGDMNKHVVLAKAAIRNLGKVKNVTRQRGRSFASKLSWIGSKGQISFKDLNVNIVS